VTAILVVAAILGVPAIAFTLWPLLGPAGRARRLLPVAPDPRDQLAEEKRAIYGTLRELDFEHDAGHLSDDDWAALRERHEARAAEVLTALDRLPPRPVPADRAERPRTREATAVAPWTRRGAALVLFGVALGLGAARYSEPDPSAGMAMPGSRPLAAIPGGPPSPEAPSAANAPRGPVTPEMLQGMLRAARTSLYAGRYSEAIAAYQAVLKRDPSNVDALTHLGVIVAVGGHGDAALEALDRALAIDPGYPAAHLYRGQVLYEIKRDFAGAAAAWEKFLALVPAGEDHDRVAALVRQARARAGPRTPE
jgi:tetratricopeptide (TPR) repeat protein